jgi:electron transport protein HydN
MNNLVICDPGKCIGCRTCEVACVLGHATGDALADLSSAHFVPRLKVIKTSKVSAPVQCRQCDDAPCAKVCPTGAINYLRNSVQVAQRLCIGCKSCMMACLYGAMQVVPRETIVVENQPGTYYGEATGGRVQAFKCDLCLHRTEGPACIQVCPTKALSSISGEVLAERMKKKREYAAATLAQL